MTAQASAAIPAALAQRLQIPKHSDSKHKSLYWKLFTPTAFFAAKHCDHAHDARPALPATQQTRAKRSYPSPVNAFRHGRMVQLHTGPHPARGSSRTPRQAQQRSRHRRHRRRSSLCGGRRRHDCRRRRFTPCSACLRTTTTQDEG